MLRKEIFQPGRASLPARARSVHFQMEFLMTLTNANTGKSSGMTFQQYMRRPVYKVQCHTMQIAQQLCGLQPQQGKGRITALSTSDTDGLTRFRCLPGHRTDAAKSLRLRVAHHVKQLRREAALMV